MRLTLGDGRYELMYPDSIDVKHKYGDSLHYHWPLSGATHMWILISLASVSISSFSLTLPLKTFTNSSITTSSKIMAYWEWCREASPTTNSGVAGVCPASHGHLGDEYKPLTTRLLYV